VETGLLDTKYGKYTELIKGDIREGQELVTGIKPRTNVFFGQ
jgi:hypothetical protein